MIQLIASLIFKRILKGGCHRSWRKTGDNITQQPNNYTSLFSVPTEAPPSKLMDVHSHSSSVTPHIRRVIDWNMAADADRLEQWRLAQSETLFLFPYFQNQGCERVPFFFLLFCIFPIQNPALD